ncbi:MAG: DUF2911 domain-containing protein [Pedosphaera sp.]|nr:DUF2911 domain-containing protein [Pedosphaera sp.]
MKKATIALCFFAVTWIVTLSAPEQKILKTTFIERTSPHVTYTALIGPHDSTRIGTRITIVYGRPYSKDPETGETRKIWGKLVPYGHAWRKGADESTLLMTTRAIVAGGKTIPAGAYTLYFIPNENGPSQLV